MLLVKRIEL